MCHSWIQWNLEALVVSEIQQVQFRHPWHQVSEVNWTILLLAYDHVQVYIALLQELNDEDHELYTIESMIAEDLSEHLQDAHCSQTHT